MQQSLTKRGLVFGTVLHTARYFSIASKTFPYKELAKLPIVFEVGIDMLTGDQVRVELRER